MWPSARLGRESVHPMGKDAPRRTHLFRRVSGEQAGFTLVEVIAAISVFAVLAGALAATIGNGLDLTRNNRNRDVAANLASQEMDTVRSANFTTLPLGQTQSTQSVDGVPYTVTRESEWVATGASTGACDSAGQLPSLLRVSVRISWAAMHGTPAVKSDTVLTPPVGAYDPNTGHIGVKVNDRLAAPAAGHPVHVVGPGVDRTIVTTSDGCAFFDHLPAGTYTVTLNTVGYVDRQSDPDPQQTAGVVTGAVTAVGFDYDQAASLELTITPEGGGVLPASLQLALANTAFLPSGTKLYPGTGSPRSIGNLFPANDGYEVWVGDCADADPEGLDGGGGAIWEGGQRTSPIQTTPGGTESATVAPASVSVTVTTVGVPEPDKTVLAVHSSDMGCPTGETVTLGTTDATGSIVAGLPYGSWTVQVQGSTPESSWPTAVVDPTGSTVVAVSVALG